MGGVDQSDHMTKVYAVMRKCYKWTNVFFYSFLDTAVVNSYIIYKKLNPETQLTQLDFHRAVVCELVERFSETQVAPHPAIITPVPPTAFCLPSWKPDNHPVLFFQDDRRAQCASCKECTYVYCERCRLAFYCSRARNCFYTYHHSVDARHQVNKDMSQTKLSMCFVDRDQ
jgi:hypothetical protein